MADTFGRSRDGDAAVVIDHGEDRLSVAALDREHRAEQAWQAASALGGIGDIRNDRLHVRVIDECTTQRCSSRCSGYATVTIGFPFSGIRFDTSIQFGAFERVCETASRQPICSLWRSTICILGLNSDELTADSLS
jgi:hypothetical protein